MIARVLLTACLKQSSVFVAGNLKVAGNNCRESVNCSVTVVGM